MFQDIWVLKETGFKRGGFFVEIGAYNGVDLSNTHLLEKSFGWTGILAEPNPQHHDNIRAKRIARLSGKCVHAVSGETLPFWVTKEMALSSLASHATSDRHARSRASDYTEIKVETISLNDLLAGQEAPADIDFISIDTEGNEPEILSTFDFARWRPRLWCIEHNRAREGVIDALMLPHGYSRRRARLSGHDAWYVGRSGQ